jgi:hypothetical protein
MPTNYLLNHKRLSFFLSLLISFSNIIAFEKTPPSIKIPKLSGKIKIDGYLDENAWKNSAKIQNFYSYYPVDGKLADEKTAVLIGYSEASLYIGIICFDPAPDQIRATISKRDEILDDDHIVLFLDTFNSGRESYEFCFNPYGIQADGIYIDMVAQDFTPDYIFYSKGRRFQGGYIIEAEIPFKSIRFPNSPDLIWGVSIMRSIKHLDKELIWPEISLNSTTFIPQFAKLEGIKGITGGSHIEILPEFTTIQQGNLNLENGNFEQESMDYDAGINLKYGVLPNLTLDFAYNPDFSQVEADADKIDVNRRFPLYYDEKRPFFLEGTNIFKTPIDAVYTRRIVDPVLGIKATGNLAGLEIGVMGGIDEYYGSEEYLSSSGLARSYYDPRFDFNQFIDEYKNANSFHSILRLKKSIWDYSHVGLLVTDKRINDSYSTTYGIDGNLLIAAEYSLTFQALNSHSRDIYNNEYINDPAFYISLFRGSRTFNFQLLYNDIFPDFEVANGFLERTDFREGILQAYYDFRSASSYFTLLRPLLYLTQMYNHNGRKIESYINPRLMIESRGNNSLTISYTRQFEEYGGLDFKKDIYWIDLRSKTFYWLFFNASAVWGDGIYYDALYYGMQPFLGDIRSLQLGFELRPIKNWSTDLQYRKYLFSGSRNLIEYRTKQNIFRFRTNFQFTREFFLRFIIENNDYYKDLDINVLFSYHPSPGTVIFIGYNDYFMQSEGNISATLSLGGSNYQRYARGFFVKLSYLFRL